MSTQSFTAPKPWQKYAFRLLTCFIFVMLALHWLHLSADPNWKLGLLTGKDWAGDFFTDEGWEAKGAIRAVLLGDWHAPGELNLAVESPLWPLILYRPFKVFGVGIGVARTIAMTFYALSVLAMYLFVKRLSNRREALIVAAILSVNVLGFTFGRAALVEPIFVSFVVISLLLALCAADRGSFLFSTAAGFLLSLALLVKLTAAFAFVPLIAILWLRSTTYRKRILLTTVAVFMAGVLPLLQHTFLIPRYPLDQNVYLQSNILDRKVAGLHQWLVANVRILFGLRAVGPFLLLAFVVGTICFLLIRRRKQNDMVFVLGMIWLLANLAIFSTVWYFPPRYCLSLLFPLTLLAVHYASALESTHRRIGFALYTFLGLSVAVDSLQDLRYLANPTYTMVGLSEQIKQNLSGHQESSCPFMSPMGDTISLYNQVPAANYWGPGPRWQRIMECNPELFVTRDNVHGGIEEQFRMAGKSLVLRSSYAALAGHAGDEPESLYEVRPLPLHNP